MPVLDIGGRAVGDAHPTYFIAEIAASHDGDLGRALELIHLAAEAGADAAKFQHFRAEHIVSRAGFESGPHWLTSKRGRKQCSTSIERPLFPGNGPSNSRRRAMKLAFIFFLAV